jgi:GNAT superfamily N-acetyltransferase
MSAPPTPSLSPALLGRIEDASLNASAPPQQRWLDGWIVRTNPGKAKRARCINAVATGRLPLAEKLALAQSVFTEAGLPMVVRITPFTQPADLDAQLAALGWSELDDTRVMVCAAWPNAGAGVDQPLPPGLAWQALGPDDYAHAVGALRGSTQEQIRAHAARIAASPVPYRGFALSACAPNGQVGSVVACGQFVREAELVGLYDVFTAPSHRQRGLAGLLCERLLSLASHEGARVAYLQVEGDNHAARRIYTRLGFADAYRYHYRLAPGAQL